MPDQEITDPIALANRLVWDEPFLGTWAEYAQANFRMPGSAVSREGSVDLTEAPWTIDVVNDCNPANGVNFNTFVKPVQTCGSGAGECAIGCALKFLDRGDIQYNWESDDKAKDRWKKRFQKFLEVIADLLGLPIHDNTLYQTCLIILDRLNFTMQGVVSEGNLASDSVRFQVNEEIHNWDAGKLELAYGRTKAYQSSWFHILNISNASRTGDQLHQAMLEGTNQEWVVKCGGCGLYHAMRVRWEDHKPELGGLRYDSTASKRSDGSYDYNKLMPTIRYQMPCGFEIHRLADRAEDLKHRRKLSQTGKYGEPRNTGAPLNNRSRTLEAVSAHHIDWMLLIQQKHKALKALYYGHPELWETYQKEVECRFVNVNDRPLVHNIKTRAEVKKNREGLLNRKGRFYALDRQQGRADAVIPDLRLEHWWLMIADAGFVEGKLKIQIVFEGYVLTNPDVVRILEEHGIKPHENRHFGVADCTYKKTEVQAFCFANGINAIFATGNEFFTHAGGIKQVFSEEKTLAATIGAPNKYPLVRARDGKMIPDKREPLFWLFSEAGVKDLLSFLQSAPGVEFIIPGDVSDFYRAHMESWRQERKKLSDGSTVIDWYQIRADDHLWICLGYIAMLLRMAGLSASIISEKPEERK